MALLLSIDTATEIAVVVLGDSQQTLDIQINKEQKDHAGFVQKAIQQILNNHTLHGEDLDGIAVSAGPGSYTGLRVGLASAKGLCFGWNKPLILLNTLEIMARQAFLQEKMTGRLYCPMIDARRREVFSGLYDADLSALINPGAYILDESAFKQQLESQKHPIYFFGSGMQKWRESNTKNSYFFLDLNTGNAQALNQLAQQQFSLKRFADVAYSEPLYFKSFYTTAKVNPRN